MKQSWLEVREFFVKEGKMGSSAHWNKIKTVYAIGKKANKLSKIYQMELNNGLDVDNRDALRASIKDINNYSYYVVMAAPWSQMRDYRPSEIVKAIENAKEYIPLN